MYLPNIIIIKILNQYISQLDSKTQLVPVLEKLLIICKSWHNSILNNVDCGLYKVETPLRFALYQKIAKYYHGLKCQLTAFHETLIDQLPTEMRHMIGSLSTKHTTDTLLYYEDLEDLYIDDIPKNSFKNTHMKLYGSGGEIYRKELLKKLSLRFSYRLADNQFDLKDLLESISQYSPKLKILNFKFSRLAEADGTNRSPFSRQPADDNHKKDLLPHLSNFNILLQMKSLDILNLTSTFLEFPDIAVITDHLRLREFEISDIEIGPVSQIDNKSIWPEVLSKFHNQPTIKKMKWSINYFTTVQSIVNLINNNSCLVSLSLSFSPFGASMPKIDYEGLSIQNSTITELNIVQMQCEIIDLWTSVSSLQILPILTKSRVTHHQNQKYINVSYNDVDLELYLSPTVLPKLQEIYIGEGTNQIELPLQIKSLLLNHPTLTSINFDAIKFQDFLNILENSVHLIELSAVKLEMFDSDQFTESLLKNKSVLKIRIVDVTGTMKPTLKSYILSLVKIFKSASQITSLRYPGISAIFIDCNAYSKELSILEQTLQMAPNTKLFVFFGELTSLRSHLEPIYNLIKIKF
ncbi:hypothetical protein DLAC_03830 [Tieghemostelium lacteum]|uniref:Uncharacterized protein n=1 Tax=Tieghemostelium lacteum TaxID=361077 RepID=A0A152A176_TIELA|nr:hypothetical protein DLAC_03830 [Tieghemostelium lacteum]|eukprot:KYQ99876.1 hypothetical protein DLAC_03830 [Tieghemostelium lacteum]